MDRRRFIKLSAAVGAAAALPGALEGAVAKESEIVVAKGPSPAKITRAAVDALGGMGRFVHKGANVVIKPNMGWDRKEEHAANTNPQVVAEVVKMCFESGAASVLLFDRTVNDPRRCYKQSGIQDAVEALGAKCEHIDERRFRKTAIPGGKAINNWPLYIDALDADVLINVPIAKDHGLARLTMSLKNWMGVMGGMRSRIHQKLDQSLADLALVIKPHLTVLDAVRILTANGPQGGDLKDVKRLDTVIAGVDQVAIDAFGSTLFGLKPEDLGYLRAASEAGIGVADLARIKIRRIELS